MAVYFTGEAVKSSSDVIPVIEERYKKDETDEFLKPIVVGTEGRIKGLFKCSISGDISVLDRLGLFSGRHTLLL
jgi:hypothetical protein